MPDETASPRQLRPHLDEVASGEELRRWYWTATELATLARRLGVRTTGPKLALTERLVAALDGSPVTDEHPPARRDPNAGRAQQLAGPLSGTTVLPPGQRCSQHLRAWFTAQIGSAFRFDGAMRSFVSEGAGRTLAEGVEHWYATRDRATAPDRPIAPQFELNRFLRNWRSEHPGGRHTDALAAWAEHRARPRGPSTG